MPRFKVGDSGCQVEIHPDWHVLDVGSGESPHPRANVLLDRFVEDNVHRSGQAMDAADHRLVVGDAMEMPFGDLMFDYAIASHVAEHVDDPARFCREIARVASAGYIETPGRLWGHFIEEPFHLWRVRKSGRGLRFDRVTNPRPLGMLGDLAYGLVYMGRHREGRWTLTSRWKPLNRALFFGQRVLGRLRRLPGLRGLAYTCYEWMGDIPVEVHE